MKINPKIFKAYDVRGIYPEEINEGTAGRIAKAFAKFLSPKIIVIGHDMRDSSRYLHKSCIKGLVSMGIDVLDIGLTSTPMLYYAVPHLKADGGIMVTASHNPINYSGLKFVDRNSSPIFIENGLKKIAKLSEQDFANRNKEGQIETLNILKDYAQFLRKKVGNFKKFKIAVDTMHGTMGPAVKELLRESGLKIEFISNEPDTRIPGYKTPNPSLKENRERIKASILKKNADFGIMFDADGDRLAVLDSKGELVQPSFALALIIKEVLLENGKRTVVCDVRASKAVDDAVGEVKGKLVRAISGHPYIKVAMKKNDAILGAEATGHFMFKENNYSEDGLLALIYLLRYLSNSKETPQQIFDRFKRNYFVIEETNFQTTIPDILERVAVKYESGTMYRIDGLTVEFPEYWFNLRVSNTEPLIRLNMEANSKEILEEKKKELTDFLLKNGCKLV